MSDHAASSGTITIGVGGRTSRQSLFDVAAGRSVQIALPEQFSGDSLALASKDLELLQTLLSERSSEISDIVASVNSGEFKAAQRMAEQIGLSEDSFMKQGGGLLALVIVIAVAAAVLLEHD